MRQYYLLRSSPTRVIPLFVWAAIDIILWGFITRYLNQISGITGNFVPALLGAVLLWHWFVRVMQGVTMTFFEDLWARNFLNMFATPLTIPEYLTGLVACGILTSLVGLAVMVGLATLAFGLSLFAYGAMWVPFLFVLFLFGIALGIFGCALVLRLGPSSEWFVWPIPAVLAPFAGVFYPIETLPHWMHWIAYAIPPSYVFEAVRAIVAGEAPPAGHLLIATLLSALYILIAGFGFFAVYRRAVRTGLLARYSAESVS
jgi:ABC-2 type transport system permease protein